MIFSIHPPHLFGFYEFWGEEKDNYIFFLSYVLLYSGFWKFWEVFFLSQLPSNHTTLKNLNGGKLLNAYLQPHHFEELIKGMENVITKDTWT